MNLWPFKLQPYKMVKHSQTIRSQKPTYYLSVFDNFVGLALKGLSIYIRDIRINFANFYFSE